MNREQVLALLATAESDLEVWEMSDEEEIDVTVYDFEGFDEHWSEIDRELDNPELVERIYDTLRDNCVEFDEGFYQDFYFEGFRVHWGYASYDI